MKKLTHRLLRWMFPSLTMTRAESIQALQALNRKLREEQEESRKWRERCCSAEQILSNGIPAKVEELLKAHDVKHRSSLSWRWR